MNLVKVWRDGDVGTYWLLCLKGSSSLPVRIGINARSYDEADRKLREIGYMPMRNQQ